ncbi:MAG: TetR/AcrR family transcriptional regulator [Cyclobacteriaceae bacterium]
MADPIKNKKYLKILASAHDLFWKHGFRRVSVEEICKQAEVSKMTYYRFFPNKIELAKAVFDQLVEDGTEKFRTVFREDTTSAEKIRKMIVLKTDATNNISREFLNDFYNDRELGLKDYIEEKTRNSWNEILKDFRHAQEKGWFRSDMKPEFLFYFSQKVGEMLSDEKLLSLYESPHDLIIEMTNFFSYGISPKRE